MFFSYKGLSLRELAVLLRQSAAANQQQTAAAGDQDPPLLIGGSNPQRTAILATSYEFFSRDELVREFHRVSIKLDGLRTSARFDADGAKAFEEVAKEKQAVAAALIEKGIDVSALL